MGKYQLIYFNVRGRGEAIRTLLKDNGIDYEEINCGNNWQKEWKPQMQFGQTPALRDNDFLLVQSNAILRHLARKHGLYGDTEEEAALIDMINDGVEDLRSKYVNLIYRNYENGKDEYIADLPNQLQPFEKLLSSNGADRSGCCVGTKRSFADYNLSDLLDVHVVLAPKCLEDFPTLKAYYQQYLARPGILEYRETEAFKQRPINGNGKQ
ncbi:glutathione S-transferase P 1-like isoform X2 [Biomphalaria glabrata]|uniref:glutathione transferase n=1 Tax=Biomphalaria glabrata TaxID=6526 RepID=A0A182YTX9_BIOGL|nr:glutathione S-transferase P 1-like isoform X1 [Biomphalaria glabrata]XP_055889865.1 glutathione S-transferase P 1-like isoform X2 [Biomphalaria glabrata]